MYNIDLALAQTAVSYIKNHLSSQIPSTALILGSGFSKFTESEIIRDIISIKLSEIPNFPSSNVLGHKGQLSIVTLDKGKKVLVMEGRFHYYEGLSISLITLPVVVFALLGVKILITTNAAGGINKSFNPGELMLIEDHINLTGNNPLIGENNEKLGKRFLDMSEPYSLRLIEIAQTLAQAQGLVAQKGVYLGITGPTYETKAEIRAFSALGADAVGMSTIFEVIMANYFQMEVLGISCITNMATGISNVKHEHTHILEVANRNSNKVASWLAYIINNS